MLDFLLTENCLIKHIIESGKLVLSFLQVMSHSDMERFWNL